MKDVKRTVTLDGALNGATSWHVWHRHLLRMWPTYGSGIFAVIVTNISEVLTPKFVQWTIDSITAGAHSKVSRHLTLLVSLLLFQFWARIHWRRTLGQQTHRVAAQMKSLLWDRARYLPKERLEQDLSPGELMNVATGDVSIARLMFGFTLVGTTDFIFLLLFSIGAMLSVDVPLTLMSLAFLPIIPFFTNRLARQESARHGEAQSALASLTDLCSQAVTTQRLQRVSQTHRFWREKLLAAADHYRARRLEVVKTSLSFIPITGLAPLIAFSLLLWLGTQKVIAGQLSIGEFVALQSYVFLIQGPMFELGVIVSEWQRSKSSFDRLLKTLASPESPHLRTGGVTPEEPRSTPSEASAPRLIYQAKNLSFCHPDALIPLFENVSFNLQEGDRLGITGPVGSGKTIFLEILSGSEKRFEGELLFDGLDIRTLSHASLRDCIAVVPQRPFLFGDTVRNNLCLNETFHDDELLHALELAGVREDVAQLPRGLLTPLGEWGVNLSGGQKQRLTLARALLRNPRVLILDDCLSAIDTLTEERILTGLDREFNKTTLIWVAHRPSTLRFCNKRLVLGGMNSTGEPHA